MAAFFWGNEDARRSSHEKGFAQCAKRGAIFRHGAVCRRIERLSGIHRPGRGLYSLGRSVSVGVRIHRDPVQVACTAP